MKRPFDIAVSLIALLALSPLLLLIALSVRVKLGSPVLFRQVRPGLHCRPFKLLKFRTMTNLSDTGCGLPPDAQRLTPFGKFLRSSSLDELPEFWNVLWGEMSLVGPRPLLLEYVPLYSRHQARRHEVRPGLTGWAQVNGRNAITWGEKLALDTWYVDHRGFTLDIKILLMTIAKVLRRDGINAEGEATASRFEGSQTYD